MHSQEITDTFRIFKASEAAKAHALLTADIDPATVPACYGGTLGGFTRQMRDEIVQQLLTGLAGAGRHRRRRGEHGVGRRDVDEDGQHSL